MADFWHDFKAGEVDDAPLLIGATVINSAGFAALPAVTAPATMRLVLDPEGVDGTPEIVLVTAHTAAATSLTVTRGQETALGGSAAREHAEDTPWVAGVTAAQLASFLTGIPNDSVTSAAIAAGAVGSSEIADDAVTASEIAAGAVGTAELADDAVTVAKLDSGIFQSGGETGPDAAGPTSGTTPLTIDQITLPDPGVPGRLHMWASILISKTVDTARFSLALAVNGGATFAGTLESDADTLSTPLAVSGSVAIAGGSDTTIDVVLTRFSGASGTATVSGSTNDSVHWIFIPTLP